MDDETEAGPLIENERDSLHILPLNILPLQTPGLSRARMIKNAHLTSVVELFHEESAGSGQLHISDVALEFGWDDTSHPDLKLLRRVAALPSYDVFSLRVALREIGVEISDQSALQLSSEMNRELGNYMQGFTHPLIQQIYGGDDVEIETFDDILKLFRDPDVKKALEKLHMMADKLGIEVEELPKFLEDYGDIFMSLSYYRRCMDTIEPIISDFLYAIPELRNNYTLKNDQSLQKTLNMLETKINELTIQIAGRFESFERGTKNMWDDISAEKFQRLQAVIKSYHTSLGAVLCALSLKMDAWHAKFPNKDTGGPQKRSEFIMIEMRQGMENVRKLDDDAPMLAGLA